MAMADTDISSMTLDTLLEDVNDNASSIPQNMADTDISSMTLDTLLEDVSDNASSIPQNMTDTDISSMMLDTFLGDVNDNASSIPQVCSQCNSKTQWYMINFEEKLLMCINDKCTFPFEGEENIVVGPINSTDEPVIPTKQATKCYTTDISTTMNVHTYLQSADVRITKTLRSKTRLEKCLETSAKVTDILCARKKKKITDVTDPELLKKLLHLEKLTNKSILTPGELEKLSKVEENKLEFEIQVPTGPDQVYKIDFSNNKDQLELT